MSIADKLTTIAENQHRIYQAGYDKGKEDGGGSAEDYEKGVEDGKKAEYEAIINSEQAEEADFIDALNKLGVK